MRISDWSSDVCSSDLSPPGCPPRCGPARRPSPAPLTAGVLPELEPPLPAPPHPALLALVWLRQRPAPARRREDRKSVVKGKRVSVRVDLGGRRLIKKKTHVKH